MTIRTDLSFDMEVSPRIITVASPSTEITLQDLHDTVVDFEDFHEGGQHPRLIQSAGKDILGGGILVGITSTLQNAKLAFEARLGPTFIQCTVSGGNLVAVDSGGSPISPIEPTAFTQVVITNSSSATLQEQGAIQYSSYNGGVTIDVTSSNTGTDYPIGTPQAPVNNIDDAYDIAVARGFPDFFIIGDLHLTASVPILDGYTFIGSGKDRTTITLDALATVSDCTYIEAKVTGTLDGDSRLQDCLIENLNFIKGFIEQCVLSAGTIVLGGGNIAHFLDCWSGVAGTGTPVIDCGGVGQGLALRNYNGGIKLINKTGAGEAISVDLNSGQIIVDDTVTAGDVILRGVGNWSNSDTYIGTANVIDQLVEGDKLSDLHRSAFNRRKWDKTANTVTLYDDDGITPLYVFDTNADLSELTPQ